MKLKSFRNKIIAILIMSVAFVVGMKAQTCKYPLSNNDFKQLACILTKDTLKVKTIGGGTSNRQSTQDSIKKALYLPNGVSIVRIDSLIALTLNGYSGVIQPKKNSIRYYDSLIVNNTDSIKKLLKNSDIGYGVTIGSICNFIATYTGDTWQQLISANLNLDAILTEANTTNAQLNNLLSYVQSNGNGYLDNVRPIDTLLTNTSYSSLVNDLNAFYQNPFHGFSNILQESHSNALVGATLTYYCVIRYKH